jgi:prolyl oligopeptidase
MVLGASGLPAPGQSNAELNELADRYWEATLERQPTWATSLGDYRFNDRLEDLSEGGWQQWKATLNALLRDVRGIPAANLSRQDRLTRDILERILGDKLLRIECREYCMPLDPLYGPHVSFPLIIVAQPFRSAADFRAYVTRLRGFPQQVTDAIDNMRMGLALGLVSPRVIVERTLPQIRGQIVGDPRESVFYSPIEKAAGLEEDDREVVAAAITDAIAADVIPAYLRLLAFVEDEYQPQARSTVGLSAVPNGDKLYKALTYLHTTIPMSPTEIHDLGLAEVARIRTEMSKVKDELGFVGSLDDVLVHMRTTPDQRFSSRDALLAEAEAILTRTKPLLPKLFGRLPKADCVVKELESHRAAAAPMAYYNLPPEDGSRPAYYYVNTHAPQERLRFTLEALTYHETIPGHHLQMALDQETAGLPKFRRYVRFNAYWEGWALYAEKLGYEIGGYRTPAARFGQLTLEMWRACRLVVDTGIHAKGWSRQRAVNYLAANTSLALHDIEVEVDRYITWPAQAPAYKIGELRFQAIRREAEQVLGDRFDIRAFHDALLVGGAMPIDMLESRMHQWVESQRK